MKIKFIACSDFKNLSGANLPASFHDSFIDGPGSNLFETHEFCEVLALARGYFVSVGEYF